MTTNETSFFRDPPASTICATVVLPALTAARMTKRPSAHLVRGGLDGTGALFAGDAAHDAGLAAGGWKIDLFATDLSRRCGGAHASGHSMPNMSATRPAQGYRARYFTQEDEQWRVADHLRRSLRVHKFNLLDNYGWLGKIDLILCRNVLFYFDAAARIETLARLDGCLAADGWLVLGRRRSAAAQSLRARRRCPRRLCEGATARAAGRLASPADLPPIINSARRMPP